MNFGLGAEQFGIDAANWNIGIDSGNPFIVAATTDAIREQQETLAATALIQETSLVSGMTIKHQFEEPERQSDIVNDRPIIDVAKVAEEATKLMNSPEFSDKRKVIEGQIDSAQSTKRKYTKRAK